MPCNNWDALHTMHSQDSLTNKTQSERLMKPNYKARASCWLPAQQQTINIVPCVWLIFSSPLMKDTESDTVILHTTRNKPSAIRPRWRASRALKDSVLCSMGCLTSRKRCLDQWSQRHSATCSQCPGEPFWRETTQGACQWPFLNSDDTDLLWAEYSNEKHRHTQLMTFFFRCCSTWPGISELWTEAYFQS